MEFSTFTAMASERGEAARPASASRSSVPWVPNGRGAHHHRTRGLPSKAEREASAGKDAAAADHASLCSNVDAAEHAMQRLEHRLDGFAAEFEQHVISSTAASVLVAKRLRELGL